MSKKRLCIVCHLRPPTVPDRYAMGRQIARVCSECHSARLTGDTRRILKKAEQSPERGGSGG
jgi:hypothetical protein